MTPLLELKNIHVQRGKKTVLTIEQLTIHQAETLAIIGPNGAGKSTLLLTLSRLLIPNTGDILWRGKPASAETDLAYRRRIALVLQDPLLFDMSVYDNIAAGLRFRKVSKQDIDHAVTAWLDRLGISALRKRRATDLSGGEAQRVSLARALVLEPELLLLDEPFSALDPPTRRQLTADLASLLAETNTTTVLITHDLDEAAQLGSRLGIVLGGKLREVGDMVALQNSVDVEVQTFLSQ